MVDVNSISEPAKSLKVWGSEENACIEDSEEDSDDEEMALIIKKI